eukprot:9570982-Alexandrium_andersonii.AAC.1
MGHVIFLAELGFIEAATGATSRVAEHILPDAASRTSQTSALPILTARNREPPYDTARREDGRRLSMD